MLRHVISAALLVSVVFVSARDESVTSASGVNIHFTDAKPGELEMLAAAGFKHIRMDFTWAATEKEKGVYDFSAYDRLTASLEKHGLKAYYILDYGNPIYEKERSVRTEEGRVAYTKWALAAVGHFKGRGVTWEIWNEPNGGFWAPIANVSEYTALAVMASKAIKEAHPEEYLCGPATSTIDMAFLEGCFKAGLLEWWDSVTVHPYRQGGPESVDLEYYALRSLIAKYAPKGKVVPIVSGEWGYSSAWMNHDDDLQGKMLARQWLVNAANKIPISVWYDWRDDGPDPKEAEHNFGTVELSYHEGRDPVFDAKPSYHAAKTFNDTLRGYRFVKRLSLGNTDHQALLFEKDGRHLLAAWTSARSGQAVKLASENGNFKVTGHLGEGLPEVSAKDGMLEFTVTDSPRYYVFGGENAKMAGVAEALLIKVAIVPATGDEVLVKIENLSGRALEAKVMLDGVSGLAVDGGARAVSIPADAKVTDVIFPVSEAPAGNYVLGAKMAVGNVVVSEIMPRMFASMGDEVLKGSHVVGEGDKKVGGKFMLSQAEAPEKFPGGSGVVMKLDYEFEAGWKYAPVYPADAGMPLEGRAGEEHGRALFGMWIFGDESHLMPRLRVKDAAGRVWQPSATEIKWKGWKYVEMTLDETTSNWGGEDDKQKRGAKFPLKWEAPFLLDNPLRVAAKGTVWFSMPVLILE